MNRKTTPALIAESQLEVEIEGSLESVWKALTEEIGAWWPSEFYVGGEAGKRTYNLDAVPGGKMQELWADGGGLLWGTVATVVPRKQLQVVGSTFPNWGGPSLWFGTWDLESKGDRTVLRFSDSSLGNVSEQRLEDTEKGWRFLFSKVLKAHVEGTPTPEWED